MSWFQSPIPLIKNAFAKTKVPAYTDFADLDSIKTNRTAEAQESASTRTNVLGSVLGPETGRSWNSGAIRRLRAAVLSYAY